jgi:hypothetical protein
VVVWLDVQKHVMMMPQLLRAAYASEGVRLCGGYLRLRE